MNRQPSNSPETEKPPFWETAVMVASFALVWAYFLAFQNAQREELALNIEWKAALLAAIGALVWVFVRRLKRILVALKER